MRAVAAGRLRDVDGQVADALEVGIDLDRRHDGAQVRSHGLIQREQRKTAVVDFDVQPVNRFVLDEHAIDQFEIAIDEAFDRQTDVLFSQTTHFEQPRLELFELFLEMSDDAPGRLHQSWSPG